MTTNEIIHAENTLAAIAQWILALGVLGGAILISFWVGSEFDSELIWQLIVGLSVAASSTVTWAILNVLCGISQNLRMLNGKTPRQP